MKVTVYGDSILKGVCYEDGQYHVTPCWEQRFSQALGVDICNRSHFGFTIHHALPSIRRCSGKPTDGEEITVLEFGGNDCDFDWAAIAAEPKGRHRCHTPPEEFVSEYLMAIHLLREGGRVPVLMSLPPILPERYLTFICREGLSRQSILEWLGDVEAISRWQETYSNLIEQIAREEQVLMINLRRAFRQSDLPLEELVCADGIHPSAQGQDLIYYTVMTETGNLTALA